MKQVTENIFRVNNNAYVLAGKSGAFVEFADTKPIIGEASPIKTITFGKNGQKEFASWGRNNNLPIERELLVMDNNIVPELMRTKRDIILGNGTMLYKERFEPDGKGRFTRFVDECEMSNQMKDWLEENESDEFLEDAAKELVLQAQFFPEFVHKAGGDCVEVNLHECAYVRAQKQAQRNKTGRYDILNWFLCGEWKNGGANGDIETIPNFNKKKDFQGKYIRRYADKMFGGPYYYSPSYWGSRNWIQLANSIPIFHLSNLKNGYSLRYHIKFPKDYFLQSEKPLNQLTETQRKEVLANADAARQLFMQRLDAMLSGEKNAGKTLWTTYDVKRNLNEKYPGVIVESITADLKDESLLKLFDKSNDANISAQGILPSLSGVATAGKLSSGSDIRNAFTFYIAAKTRVMRRNLYAPYNRVGKVNKWFTGKYAGCKLGVRDVVIATTDKEPTGMKTNENLN